MANRSRSKKTKTATGAAAAKTRPPRVPTMLKAAPALKRAFAKASARLAALRAQGSASYDAFWELVDDMMRAQPPLWLGGGYRTEKEFVAAELPGETKRSVARNRLVARCFTPADEARHGINFLEEAALYAQALAGAAEPPAAIDLDRLKLSLRRKDGDRVNKAVRGATIDELRQARRALRGAAATRQSASPKEKAMREALARRAPLRAVGVRLVRGRWSFSAVPEAALATFGKTVAAVKLPRA
jgi:hypothetical protein